MNLRNLAITSVIILGLLAAYAAVSQGGAMTGAVGGPGAAGRPETITYSQLVQRAESGEWLLARDLDAVTLADLYEACQLRIPVAEAWLPCREDALGKAALAALDDLRLPLRDLLKRNIAHLYPDKKDTA